MKLTTKQKRISILLIVLAIILIFIGRQHISKNELAAYEALYRHDMVMAFANQHPGQPVIVVFKKGHLLYYCENGEIAKNVYWRGFNISFPVKVSLAGRRYFTPEGIMYIDRKNANSRYTLFLGLSYPGAYGIHAAPTHLAAFLDRMEKLDPNLTFVTRKDDTRGCVAVENRIIKYLFSKIEIGTPVWILP